MPASPQQKANLTFRLPMTADSPKNIAAARYALENVQISISSDINDLIAKIDLVKDALDSWSLYLCSPDVQQFSNEDYRKIESAIFDFVTSGDQKRFEAAIHPYLICESATSIHCNRLTTLVTTLIGAVTGFFLGFCLGSLSGPGAAFSALAAGAKGAEVGAALGTTLGGMAGYFFGKQNTLYKLTTKVAKELDRVDATQTLMNTTSNLFKHVGQVDIVYQAKKDDLDDTQLKPPGTPQSL